VASFEAVAGLLDSARWRAECSGCGKVFVSGAAVLGRKGTCKRCSTPFVFPWHDLVLDSVKSQFLGGA
jgi:rRNA maturation endonuclease Nob1